LNNSVYLIISALQRDSSLLTFSVSPGFLNLESSFALILT